MNPTIPDRRRANLREVAEFCNVPRSTVVDWTRRGCPFLVRGALNREWQFDLLAVLRWRFTPTTDPDVAFDPDRCTARERLDHYGAEHLRRKLEDRDAQLVPAAEVEAGMAELTRTIREVLGTVPDRLREIGLDDRAIAVAERHLREVS